MSTGDMTPTAAGGPEARDVQDWADLLAEVWTFLTDRRAVVDYDFRDMTIEVPRDTGANAPRATWKLNGTLRVTTSDRNAPNAHEAESGESHRGGT